MIIMQRGAACPRCHQTFTVKFRDSGRLNHNPLVLKCGHTFCENCCNRMAKEGEQKIICSICQVDSILLPGESPSKIFSPNYYLIGLLICNQKQQLNQELSRLVPSGFTHVTRKNAQKKDRFDKSGSVCCECAINAATCRCKKCDCLMCGLCFDKVHSSSNMLKQHQALPLAQESRRCEVELTSMKDRASIANFQENIAPKCKVHDSRPIEYFCDDDETPICSRCVIMGDHKGHSITSMEERNRLVFADMDPALITANQVWKHIRKTEKSLVDVFPNTKEETSSVIDEIKTHFSLLHGALQARENMLIQDVFASFSAGISPLEDLKMDLHEEKIKLEAAIRAANRVMKNSDDVIVNAKDILDHLLNAQNLQCVLAARQPDLKEGISWESGRSLMDEIMTYGSVLGSIPQRIVLKTLSEAPSDVLLDDDDTASVLSVGSSAWTDVTSTGSDVIIEDSDSVADDVSLGSNKPSKRKTSKASKKNSHSNAGKPKLQGHCEQVTVTHISTPVKFNVQRMSDKKKIHQVSKSINTWCNGLATEKDRPTDVKTGDHVLGKYSSDKQWYRCVVKGVMITTEMDGEETRIKTNVEVLYMDYGNSEVLPMESLYTMQSRFLKNPEFMLECSLYDILPADKDGIWSLEAIQTFLKMTESKPMLMTVVHEIGNVLHVDLHKPQGETDLDDRPVSVRDCLVFLELAKFATSSSGTTLSLFPSYTKRQYMTAEPQGVGEIFYAMVTSCDLPSSFYVQPAGDESDYLCNLMANMQTTYTSKGNLYSVFCPQIGMVCVSQYSLDQYWYRAVVVGLPGGRQVDVMYVDFGIQERVSYLNIRKILDTHLKLPPLAILCELADVEPASPDGTWGPEGQKWWTEAIQMKKFQVKVVDVQDDKLSVVLHEVDPSDLTVHSLSMNYYIVESGHAKSTGKWSDDLSPEKMPKSERSVSYVRMFDQGEGKTFQQLIKADDLLNTESMFPSRKISVSPNKQHPRDSADAPDVGCVMDHVNLPCDSEDSGVSKSSKPATMEADSTTRTPPKSASSTSVDIGAQLMSSSETEQVNSLTDKFVSPIPSPQKICDKPRKTESDNVDKKLDVKVAARSEHSVLENGAGSGKKKKRRGVDVSAAKDGSGTKESKATKSCDIDVKIVVTQFESPADFCVQLCNVGMEELKTIMAKLQSQFADSEPERKKWHKEEFCVAKYSKDNQWYRAKVTEVIKKNVYKVWSIDYGHMEMVPGSELRSLDNSDRHLPMKALKCHLAGVISAGSGDPDRWSKTACEYMIETITNKTLYIKQQAGLVESDIPSLPVDILIEEDVIETALEPARKKVYSLIESMKDKGLAIPLKKVEKPVQAELDIRSMLHKTYKPHPAPLSSTVVMLPTYVDYDGIIYAQPVDEECLIHQLTEDLQKEYVDCECLPVQWQVGQACVAFYKGDDAWYRARVLHILQDKIEVQYLDFGNSRTLDAGDLRLPTDAVVEVPQLCFECVFHKLKSASEDGKWPTVVLEYIHNSIVNINTTMEIMKTEENCPVEVNVILPDGTNLSSVLLNNRLAVMGVDMGFIKEQSNKIARILEKKNPFKTVTVLPEEIKFPVTVTHVELPNVMYFQYVKQESPILNEELILCFKEINSNLDQLLRLTEKLHLAIPTAKAFTCLPAPGQMCCTQYSSDDCWYRGLVVDVDENSQCVLVFYVDYGNSEDVHLHRLRVLPPEFRTLPAQAVRCKLSKLQPPSGESDWDINSLKAMVEVVSTRTVLACVSNSKSPTIEIDLFEVINCEEGITQKAYQSVLDQGLAQLTEESQLFDMAVSGKDCVSEQTIDYDADVIVEEEDCESKLVEHEEFDEEESVQEQV